MTIQTKILAALQRSDRLCDDCLSEVTGVSPRQAINQNAHSMAAQMQLSRFKEDCARCGRTKILNRLGTTPLAQIPAVSRPPSDPGVRPWYWEGNVQRKIVDFLRANGYSVQSEADTASRQHGKDIVARSPEGRLLWVTVKGFPERSKNPQARHWFQGALHDLTLYHNEDSNAVLAMGLPRGFTTYEGLLKRDVLVRRFLGYRVYWVGRDGTVTVEEPV
jgi:hypothetical protein